MTPSQKTLLAAALAVAFWVGHISAPTKIVEVPAGNLGGTGQEYSLAAANTVVTVVTATSTLIIPSRSGNAAAGCFYLVNRSSNELYVVFATSTNPTVTTSTLPLGPILRGGSIYECNHKGPVYGMADGATTTVGVTY